MGIKLNKTKVRVLGGGKMLVLNCMERELAEELVKEELIKIYSDKYLKPEVLNEIVNQDTLPFFERIIWSKSEDYYWWGDSIMCRECNRPREFDQMYAGFVFDYPVVSMVIVQMNNLNTK
jgi:hypothetical protein